MACDAPVAALEARWMHRCGRRLTAEESRTFASLARDQAAALWALDAAGRDWSLSDVPPSSGGVLPQRGAPPRRRLGATFCMHGAPPPQFWTCCRESGRTRPWRPDGEDAAKWPCVPLWLDPVTASQALTPSVLDAAGAAAASVAGTRGMSADPAAALQYVFGGADLCGRCARAVGGGSGERVAGFVDQMAAKVRRGESPLPEGCDGKFLWLEMAGSAAAMLLLPSGRLHLLSPHDAARPECSLLKLPGLIARAAEGDADAHAALFRRVVCARPDRVALQTQDVCAEPMTRRLWRLLSWAGRWGEAVAVPLRRALRVSDASMRQEPFLLHCRPSAKRLGAVLERGASASAARILRDQYGGAGVFTLESYERMRDDLDRTGGYHAAIRRECPGKVVLEIGTGPFALLALFAAEAGAAKVYAVEACKEHAESARRKVAEAGYADRVEVIAGISCDVELPQRCDVVIHELIGVLASEEGVVEAIADARQRLLKPVYTSVPPRVRTVVALMELQEQAPPPGGPGWHPGSSPDAGWRLVTDLPAAWQAAAPCVVEDLWFAAVGGNSVSTTATSRQVLQCTAVKAARVAAVGIWVEVCLGAEGETGGDLCVSSLPHQSCWPKCLACFGDSLEVEPGQTIEVGFEADFTTTPVRYAFDVRSQTGSLPPLTIGGTVGGDERKAPPHEDLAWWCGQAARHLPDPGGLVVNAVSESSPAHDAGLRQGMRVLEVAGMPAVDPQQVDSAFAHTSDKGLPLKVASGGGLSQIARGLSPLHRAALDGDAVGAGRSVSQLLALAAESELRPADMLDSGDLIWGLTPAHLAAAVGEPARFSPSGTRDPLYHGTAGSWAAGALYSPPDGAKVAACTADGMTVWGAEEFALATGSALTGRNLLCPGALLEINFQVRITADEDLRAAVRRDAPNCGCGQIVLYSGGGRPAAYAGRDFEEGEYICTAYGEIGSSIQFRGEGTGARTGLPLCADVPYCVDPTRVSSPGCYLAAAPPAAASVELRPVPEAGTVALAVIAGRFVQKHELLSLPAEPAPSDGPPQRLPVSLTA
eukprot:TRINITY_DN17092_c0_g1_i1.p1 TRINITY_DN17092_c0_g1~~TRINITY_DN17092_c0_g1_i1.p1  ORF type:complete len:1065 (+),score=273.60 TRINITY_DN17092_c0_g1_i1:51-3197(+)